jgi:hypothetical protein
LRLIKKRNEFFKINTLAARNKKNLRFAVALYPYVLILRFIQVFHFMLDSLAEFGYFYRLKNDCQHGPSF